MLLALNKDRRDINTVKQRYAWFNVAVCSVTIFFVLSAPAVLMPVMYSSIMHEMEWSYREVTSFSSWKFLSGALTSLALSIIIGRVSVKVITLVGISLSGVTLLCVQFADTIATFYMFGFLLGISAITTTITCKVLLSLWFKTHLGRAVGIAFAGGSIGGVAVPIIGALLLESIGWRMTAAMFGIIILALVLPLVAFVIRENPDELNPSLPVSKEASGKEPTHTGPELSDILKTKTFWLILFAHFLVGGADYAVLEHTALFIEKDANLSKTMAASALSIVMLASIFGKIGFGWLYDRISMRGIAVCWWSLALGIALALPVSGVITMTAFAVFRGVSHGGIMIDAPLLALHNFGTRSLAKLVCYISVANMLGASLGTTLIGYARDATGSYAVPFTILIFLTVIAGAIAFCLKPQYWRHPNRSST